MSKIKDLTGKRFGRLKVISYNGSNKYGKALWLCKCDCGNIQTVVGSSLTNNLTISCGCYNKEILKKIKTKHSMSNSELYKVWQGIKIRCYDKNSTYYNNYGGRDIKMCDEWKNDFVPFYNWAINNGYRNSLTIDRINNDGNYEPSNCRWITRREQNNNMRKNIILEYNGKGQTISEWANETGINRTTLYYRIKRGWSAEKAFTTPLRK